MDSSLVFYVVSYQKPHYSVADMLQYKGYKGNDITAIIMGAYHVLGILQKCGVPPPTSTYCSINPTKALGNR